MRFKRYPRWIVREATPLRIANSRRAIEREAAKIPLFAEQVRAVETPEARLSSIDIQQAKNWQDRRDSIARSWREGRAVLQAKPPPERQRLLARWNAAPYPGSSEYFLEFVHQRGCMATYPPA